MEDFSPQNISLNYFFTIISDMKCVVCGKKSTSNNTFGLPSCKSHLDLSKEAPRCPECDTTMQMRHRKNGAFWGCPSFPHCFGSRNLSNPMEELDIL